MLTTAVFSNRLQLLLQNAFLELTHELIQKISNSDNYSWEKVKNQ